MTGRAASAGASRQAGERGSATVLGTVLVAATAVAAALLAVVGGAVVDQRRVESAVDLGALAGATALQRGEDGCAAARAVVRRNGGRLTACSPDGAEIRVRAARSTRSVLGLRWQVTSTASAGPMDAAGRSGEASEGRPQRAGGGVW